ALAPEDLRNPNAEGALLGWLLSGQSGLLEQVRREFFTEHAYQQVFEAMLGLVGVGTKVTLVTVSDALRRRGSAIPDSLLADLTDERFTSTPDELVSLLSEYAERRALARYFTIATEALVTIPPDEVVARLQSDLATITRPST